MLLFTYKHVQKCPHLPACAKRATFHCHLFFSDIDDHPSILLSCRAPAANASRPRNRSSTCPYTNTKSLHAGTRQIRASSPSMITSTQSARPSAPPTWVNPPTWVKSRAQAARPCPAASSIHKSTTTPAVQPWARAPPQLRTLICTRLHRIFADFL